MPKNILIIQGHPDAGGGHFCHALADAYAEGALAGGHVVKRIAVGALDFPLLRTKEDWDRQPPPDVLRESQETIRWAQHIVIVYPLWLGSMPALLKAFFEQVFRPNLLGTQENAQSLLALRGRTAHIVITMGMPALIYRWYFGAHSLKSLERNILKFVGIKPVRESLIGSVEAREPKRIAWLEHMRAFGAKAA